MTMINDDDEAVGARAISAVTNIPERLVPIKAARGEIPAYRYGGRGPWRLRPSTFRKYREELERQALERGGR